MRAKYVGKLEAFVETRKTKKKYELTDEISFKSFEEGIFQVCQYLLEDFLLRDEGAQFAAIVTQPRRISAITLAERVAEERGEILGNSIGYNVRYYSFVSIN